MEHLSYFPKLRPSMNPKTSRTAISDSSVALKQVKSQHPHSTSKPLQYIPVTTDHNTKLASVTSTPVYLETPSLYSCNVCCHSTRSTRIGQ